LQNGQSCIFKSVSEIFGVQFEKGPEKKKGSYDETKMYIIVYAHHLCQWIIHTRSQLNLATAFTKFQHTPHSTLSSETFSGNVKPIIDIVHMHFKFTFSLFYCYARSKWK
jgi:hypothetical protein